MLAVDTFDSLFLGGPTVEDAGHYSPSRKPPRGFSPSRKAKEAEAEPGLLHQMAVCLPFEIIYSHGDLGIIEKAKNQVHKGAGPVIIQLPIMVLQPPAAGNGHHPQAPEFSGRERESKDLASALPPCR